MEDRQVDLEDGVAFGVCDDRRDAEVNEVAENFRSGGGDDGFTEFDEEVGEAVDGEWGGVVEGGRDVFEAEVDVAATVDAGGVGVGLGEVEDALGDEGWVVFVLVVGVWGGDDVGGACFGGDF